MDRTQNPAAAFSGARWLKAVRSWQFPAIIVLGAGIIAGCGGGKKDPNQPEPATALALTTAPPATFASRATISPAPVVQLVDANGDPVASAGVTITATLSAGAGSLQGTVSVSTDASGQASFSNLNIQGTVGTKGLTFSAAGLTSVSANGLALTAGPAATVTALTATSQAALTSTAVTTLPSVSVTDLDLNPIQGASVTFAITAGGGQVTGANQTTNASGVATVGGWTTGAAAGVNTMTATVTALTPATFNVTAAPAGVAVKLAIQTQPQATAAARATLSPAPVVQLQDVLGAAVNTAGVAVTVALNGGGTLNGTTSVNTDAAGQASFGNLNIAGTVGTRSLAFASAGLVGVTSSNVTLTAGPAAVITANSVTTQTGTTGAAVGTLPAVKVADLDGNGVQGTSILFQLTGGGGTIGGATPTTNASGIATLGSWTLGAVAGANAVTAAGNGVTLTGAPITFTVNAAAPTSNFTITLQNIGPAISPTRQAAFDNAKTRWQTVITGDLPDFNGSNIGNTGPNCGNVNLTGVTIDDLLIFFQLDSIDGPGQILGSAGPCFIRSSNNLTIVGIMRFDTADVAGLEGNGSLNDVILHEMGHVLGYGTLWTTFNLLQGACTTTPTYTGANAVAGFTGSNGGIGTTVPVENFQPGACNNGTRDSHWEEDIFRSEVMTGFISGTVRPLSLTSVRQFQDLGYVVNTAAADAFNINTQPTLRAGEDAGPQIPLGDDVLDIPLYAVDDAGRVRMIRDRK